VSRWILSSLVVTSTALAQSTIPFRGTVVDADTNKAVPHAFVSATTAPSPSAPSTKRITVQSGADGSFLFGQLLPGKYELCVQPSTEGYLDPCSWSPPAPAVTLIAGQAFSGYVLPIKRGSVVTVHINDPQSLVWQKNAKGSLPNLELGVLTPQAALRTARLAGVTATGTDYQITVPFDLSLKLSIRSFHLQLQDSTGAALVTGSSQQTFMQSSSALTAASFSYTVAGVIP
jgi:hypothetical protein